MKKFYFLLVAFGCFVVSNAQNINFPDANFKAKLISLGIDANSDGEITQTEAHAVSNLDVSSSNISDLTGLEFFDNITFFTCNNNLITNLALTNHNELISLSCRNNTQLTSLTISNLPRLFELNCQDNNLVSLSIADFPMLQYIKCYNNQLTTLTVQNIHPSAIELLCYENQITALDLSNAKFLRLACQSNLFTSIDVSHMNNLTQLFCYDNPNLKQIFYKIGTSAIASGIYFNDCPNLEYICVDENRISNVLSICASLGYNNVVVNSYCSFTPGGVFYTIQGNSKYDIDSNGCDASDINLPNLKYSISNGAVTGAMIANSSGNYSIPVQAGTHNITPILENSDYFNISPASFSVTFPTEVSPYVQDFCISPNGVHPDLEIVLLPTNPARPGFNSNYELTYVNKGNQLQSGSVSLNFDDSKMDLVATSLVPASQSVNNLTWNFAGLKPFERRSIYFTMKINASTDTPVVNTGDVLDYTATITTSATDETPNDNTFVLNQTVVNSFDPNDKTCLEGSTIAPSQVGKYVHYMIRFENTGTFPAENIVVKDMIDANMFDINSLVPMKGSHNYFTRISGNKVEFIFENINLPFDDANNDGYVAFKIKTKPTLTNGDTFSNSASIYFDYNFPIVTNTAITTIQALSAQDFEFGSYFAVYPNPVNNVLNIETKKTIEISSINIYNTLGQLVLVIPSAQNVRKIDVSSLSAGNYFIKINSDKGTANTKFIKQ
ncbi:T9SS type A sorting domain-containing protein [Flavobacterium sp. SM15]|uniref:T9SS type A sorting domain-containing protein n=1 Tax=Flavobacterium sp. SM15 TaxID=2908005 RepID=UPI001EDA40B6|nr:T9SS type A sorting domain-containing protein [Flavobacterium sp. SM15]MCG2611427.1 T9SS type A sorting domain-containing protein [Flavobacterium sp. SM15]